MSDIPFLAQAPPDAVASTAGVATGAVTGAATGVATGVAAPDATPLRVGGARSAEARARVDKIRVFVWMHARCAQWAVWAAMCVGVTQALVSFAASGLMLPTVDGGAGASAVGLGAAATAVTFVVGALSTLVRLKYFNYEAQAATHSAAIAAWNSLWAALEQELALGGAPSADALHGALVKFAELESASEDALPLWVRRAAAAAFAHAAAAPAAAAVALPDMCIDAAV